MTKEQILAIEQARPACIYMKVQSKNKKPLYDCNIRKYNLTKQSIVYSDRSAKFFVQVDRGAFLELHLNSLVMSLDPDKFNIMWAIDKSCLKKKKNYFVDLIKKPNSQIFLLDDAEYYEVTKDYSKGRTSKVSSISKLEAAHKYCTDNDHMLKIYLNGTEINYIEAVKAIDAW